MFARTPTFTLVALLALALGIGATTAIFSVVDTVLLKPLPYPQPDRLVSIGLTGIGQDSLSIAPDYMDWRARNHVFESMGGYSWTDFTLTGAGDPVRVECGRITQSLFHTLHIQPMLGRAFTRAEDQPDAPKVILLTYGTWQRRFGGSRDILEKSLMLDGVPYAVIGVLAPGFRFMEGHVEAIVPLALNEPEQATRRAMLILPVIARLKNGVSVEQARAEIDGLLDQTRKQYPRFYRPEMKISMVPLQERRVANVRLALLALLGAVGCVLLIACANVANLLLSRSAARQREIAVRAALGAGSKRLIRQLLTESTLLGLAGGAVGLVLVAISLKSILHFAPAIPRIEDVGIDPRVLAFTLLTSLAVSLTFGLTPALSAARVDLNDALKLGTRGASQRHRGLRNLLVVGELALSLVLLTGAGLLIQTLWRLEHVNTGISAEHVLTTQIPFSSHQYTEPAQRATMSKLLENVSTLPGVLSAALSDSLPPESYGVSIMFNVEGRPQHHFNEPGYEVVERSITPGYFAVLGIPLHKGRGFTDHDTEKSLQVALVNEALVRRFFPGEDPIGKRVGGGEEGNWKTIVGIVGDVKNQGLANPPRPEMYMPVQQPGMTVASTIVVRAVGDPKTLIAAVRDQVRALDKNIPLTFTTMMEEISSQVSSQRFNSILLSTFAALALLLAAIGIYGVMSYLVTQRTQEIGIRMALGARRTHVLNLVVGHALRLTAAGVIVGVSLALALTRYLSTLLYGVTARDAWTFSSVALVLVGVALLASYIPALRATRVDPATALRCE
jgi:putative ABC transport system permease protein